jgi:hypothetical protein
VTLVVYITSNLIALLILYSSSSCLLPSLSSASPPRQISVTRGDVLTCLSQMISHETLIVGHSLENDLNALGIIHRRIIDTCTLFPHHLGLPHKISLRHLAERHLGRVIQHDKTSVDGEGALPSSSSSGHCSVEDAYAALELVLRRVLMDRAEKQNKQRGETSSPPPYLPAPWPQSSSTPEERYTIFHSLCTNTKGGPSEMHLHAHCCPPLSQMPAHERHAMGYKPEYELPSSYQYFLNDPYISRIERERCKVTGSLHVLFMNHLPIIIHNSFISLFSSLFF